MFSSGPKYTKLRTNLRLCVQRLKLSEKKKTEMALKSRKEIADYIAAGKDDRARIRVEHIIREDYYVEAMEILEMFCDLLLARFGLIETQAEMDPGLEEAISSLLWATLRLQADIPEFKVVAEQFTAKYGKEYAKYARTNELSTVNEKIIHRLGVQAPPKALIESYMIEIAKSFNVPFEPDPTVMQEDEIVQAENMLINLNEGKTNGSGGGGAFGYPPQNPVPHPNAAFAYPPPSQPYPPAGGASAMPPPIPCVPPVGPSNPAHAPVFTLPQQVVGIPPAPNYNDFYDKPPAPPSGGATTYNQAGPLPPKPNLSGPPMNDLPDLPDLPAVPNSLPPGGNSAGGEDVDFDDLTKRFEELKKKK